MTIENGADPAANDDVLPNDATQQQQTHDAPDDQDNPENPDAITTEEDEDVEFEGKQYRVPREIKRGLLRQTDYTQKTMEVAEARKALETRQQAFEQSQTDHKEYRQAETNVAVFDHQLAKYKDVDWPLVLQQAFAQQAAGDGGAALNNYHQHKAIYDQLMQGRTAAADSLSKIGEKRRQETERESATRSQAAVAEIAKHIPGWTPGNEVDLRLSNFAAKLGYSAQEMTKLATQSPKVARDLERLRVLEEAAAKQKTQQTFDQQQQARPVTRVGGSGGPQQRRTTDSSGDALSAEEWGKRERERVAKLRQAQGRR